MLADFAPGQLVLVVEQVAQLRARDRGEAAGYLVVGRTLEFDRADEVAAGSGGKPALDQRQKPRRIAHDIREQPIDRSDRMRVERESALLPMLDAGDAGDFGGERRLVDADHPRADLLQCPAPAAGARSEIETGLARARPPADQGQRLPQLQIGAARRPAAILDEVNLAVGKGVCAARCGKHRPGVEQGPRPERRPWRRCPEYERFGRHSRQLLLDQRRAPVEARRIDGPIALQGPQLRRRIGNRADRDLLRIEPDIRGPCGGAWRPRSDQQPAVPRVGATELMVELLGKSRRGKVSSARAHGGEDRTPGLARRCTFAKLPAWPRIEKLPSSPERSRGRAAPSSLPEPGSAPSRAFPISAAPAGSGRAWRRSTFRISSPRRRHGVKLGGGALQWRRPYAQRPRTAVTAPLRSWSAAQRPPP